MTLLSNARVSRVAPGYTLGFLTLVLKRTQKHPDLIKLMCTAGNLRVYNNYMTLEIVGEPVETVPDIVALAAPTTETEQISGRPDDDLQKAAEALGRSNVSYEHIWEAVKKANGLWIIVRCNAARRAILLASSALQHRTQAHDVKRRGRVVCIRLFGGQSAEDPGEPVRATA